MKFLTHNYHSLSKFFFFCNTLATDGPIMYCCSLTHSQQLASSLGVVSVYSNRFSKNYTWKQDLRVFFPLSLLSGTAVKINISCTHFLWRIYYPLRLCLKYSSQDAPEGFYVALTDPPTQLKPYILPLAISVLHDLQTVAYTWELGFVQP